MDTEYWIGNVVTTVVGALVGFLLGRRKYNKEVDNIAIQNMQSSLDFYQKLSDDTSKRLDIVLDENGKLREEIERVRTENTHMKSEMKELKATVEKLTEVLTSYGLGRLIEDAENARVSDNSSRKKKNNGKETVKTETTKEAE